ncbi:MAG: hypothetical protein P0Y66_07570 [Candidatus Kaistia colombiensis]|nr:MAG: hypothetical protein P0Y66_07570 [Kaistia sp.]
MNSVRKEATSATLSAATKIVLGKKGGFPFSNTGSTYRALLRFHQLNAISPEMEVQFLVGHLNGWAEEVQEILAAMATMAALPASSPEDALEALYVLACRWGASNYLAKKIAYIVAREGNNIDLSEPLSRLADKLDQRSYSTPFFTSMEDMDPEFEYFRSISNRIRVLSKYVTDDFRQYLPLNNVAPVPVSLSDVGAFLRKAHSMSLVDEVVALVQLIALSDEWPGLMQIIENVASPHILNSVKDFLQVDFEAKLLYSDAEPNGADMTFYRRSIAFIEFPEPLRYRLFIDKIVAKRLLTRHLPNDINIGNYPRPTVRDLTRHPIGFRDPADYLKPQHAGILLRTVWFLIYIEQNRSAHALDHTSIRQIFNNTTALDLLLSEQEIENIYATADEQSKPLITVLALALYKSRANDDDIDFKFRLSLSTTIIEKFDGKVTLFIEWLLPNSPAVATFLLSVLDIATLQKLYWIISSPLEADQVRQDILRAVGKARGILAYLVEADAIQAQRQVSKLQRYFDDSRMYVDGYAMKQWLMENPTSYTQQYLRLIEHTSEITVGSKINVVRSAAVSSLDAIALSAFDYILIEVAKGAFTQFCENTTFGIESYLGRRIRHNTLTGMMRSGVETLIEKPNYQILSYDDDFIQAHSRWVAEYRALIEHLRKDILQFRSAQKPRGIFTSELNSDDESTKLNIAVLRKTAFSAKNGEVFNEILIRFCWQEIAPQLEAAAKFVSVDILNMAVEKLNANLGDFDDDLQLKLRAELQNEIHARFVRLGSWFRQPESGFVSASSRELADLIFVEATGGPVPTDEEISWSGNGFETALDGLSVHRMYDCLSVLIRNAHRYGREGSSTEVYVSLHATQQLNIARIEVRVSSKLQEGPERAVNIRKLEECFAEDDLSAAMVKEGYSGIKKLRYITLNLEGTSTVSHEIIDEMCTVSFILTVELADQSKSEQ